MIDMKTWYQSKTVWGALLTIGASFVKAAGYDVSPADQVDLADRVTTIITAAGGLLALYGRLSASKRLG